MSKSFALGLALGVLADQVWGDPKRGHPVAGFGRLATETEQISYVDTKWAGVVTELVLVGSAVGVGKLLGEVSKPLPQTLVSAAATFFVLGGTTLGREAMAVADYLDRQDLPGARIQVARIVGRATAELEAEDVARASVETVAENTSDAVVAPLFWGTIFGIPGLLGYRAINTLDAMFGYRSARYRNFGWAAARLDDLANWMPARLSALAVAVVRPKAAKRIWRTIRRDAGQHPSPNAGQVEAAFAAALGIRLGGANAYHGETEQRGILGDGPPAVGADIPKAVRLSKTVGLVSALVAVVITLFRSHTAKSR